MKDKIVLTTLMILSAVSITWLAQVDKQQQKEMQISVEKYLELEKQVGELRLEVEVEYASYGLSEDDKEDFLDDFVNRMMKGGACEETVETLIAEYQE